MTVEEIGSIIRTERIRKGLSCRDLAKLSDTSAATVCRLETGKRKGSTKAALKILKALDIKLEITDQAIQYLAQEGYDPEFGARPVKRAIQQLVLNDLSRKILAEQVNRDKPIIIDEFGDGLVFRN